MRRALELARRGVGRVEPNPAVGAVVVGDQLQLLGEGWHERYGGPHAETQALQMAGEAARGQTLFVTLEPCCHFGKTPPCADAVIAAGIRRVVISVADPAPHTSAGGMERLRAAGILVETGLLSAEGAELIAPFTRLQRSGRTYVHAKWAMSLDGKIAARTGMSRWISNSLSRERVHQLRGRMDAVLVGLGTVLADDPLLTARPAGPRTAVRVILDRRGELPLETQLVATARQVPVLLVIGPQVPRQRRCQLEQAGVELLVIDEPTPARELERLVHELGSRQMTNLLVEGGSRVLGNFRDAGLIDEVHCFLAPKLIGGQTALSPIAGVGLDAVPEASSLIQPRLEILGTDVYLHGRVRENALDSTHECSEDAAIRFQQE